MSALLLRLAAPLQSWGVDSKFDRRRTERIPTKSGVTGLVAAALGRRRNESIDDLRALKFGVRVDREGSQLRDFQTAKSIKSAYVTNRYYLADAVFLAGFEGDEALLEKIDSALCSPVFPLSLGRRSCPPEGRITLGIRACKLADALRREPLQISEWAKTKAAANLRLRISIDADDTDTGAYFKRDDPISFNREHREFGFRRIRELTAVNTDDLLNGSTVVLSEKNATTHDAMAEIDEHDPFIELKEEADTVVPVADSSER